MIDLLCPYTTEDNKFVPLIHGNIFPPTSCWLGTILPTVLYNQHISSCQSVLRPSESNSVTLKTEEAHSSRTPE